MIKTRFAPSPTGYLHVGGLRTALYAYLFAKKNDGHFILRIEDTDQTRLVEGASESLQEILKYFGLNWDEGPFVQSERREIYKKYAEKLLESGHAYRCYCTPERLTEMRENQQKAKLPPKYDRHCFNLSNKEKEDLFNQGKNHVIRMLVPNEEISFTDLVRGEVSFHGKDVDDQVLMKSDGFPTYHLAVVVDDHEMEITHVIRGEEWLPSTPKHICLYKALGLNAPVYAHLPLLLNADKSKLSKRQGDVSAEDYLKKGYLKESILNFIAFLGWNPGTEEEFFTLPELIQAFDFSRVQKAGAVFNPEKLDWLNGHYLRQMPTLELAEKLLPLLKNQGINTIKSPDDNDFLRYVDSVKTRIKTLNEGAQMLKMFLSESLDYKNLFINEKMKIDRTCAIMALENILPALQAHTSFHDEDSNKELLVNLIQKLGLKNGQIMWPLRIALSGEEFSPGAFELMSVLGKEKSIQRVEDALKVLKKY